MLDATLPVLQHQPRLFVVHLSSSHTNNFHVRICVAPTSFLRCASRCRMFFAIL